jgi:uncharacterized repeat protein (TIGR03803 family)
MKGTLTTLVDFNGTNGSQPNTGNLIADAHGNLFGTTQFGGAFGDGTVFEIAHGSGHLTTLVSFNGTNGANPEGGLVMDANGDLFGTTFNGGANNVGTVFGILNTSSGYASTPTTLVNFNGTDGSLPSGSLSIDANGNLFGATSFGGAFFGGTVFEVTKTSLGYANTPTTLVSFDGTNGSIPDGGVIADANGNLFGTTRDGGAFGVGTVFELVKSGNSYTLTTLVSFNGADGSTPLGSLIFDASGNLLGTTSGGGANQVGTVFGILNTGSGFASTPTTLASFNGADGIGSATGSLVIDANGDLFGTTRFGGTVNDGTVFEILNTPPRLRPQPHYPA